MPSTAREMGPDAGTGVGVGVGVGVAVGVGTVVAEGVGSEVEQAARRTPAATSPPKNWTFRTAPLLRPHAE